MTRINCVPPAELCGRHLVAEYRELPRVFSLAAGAEARGETPGDPRNPTAYVLGRRHLRFFYPRLLYVEGRMRAVFDEMWRGGFSAVLAEPRRRPRRLWWYGDWTPNGEALALNRARIAERLKEMGGA